MFLSQLDFFENQIVQPQLRTLQCLSPAGTHTMAYKEWGDSGNSHVLVCVHGLTRVSDDFDTLAESLCSRYRIICPDVVGRGRSSWLNDPQYYTMPYYIKDMMSLLTHLRVSSVDWLGTSMGGLIGMTLAAVPGRKIRKLILNDVGPALHQDAMTRIGDYVGQQLQFDSFEEAEQYVRKISASFGPHTDQQWHRMARSVLKQNSQGKWIRNYDPGIACAFRSQSGVGLKHTEAILWKVYEALKCDTLVIRGEHSDLLTRETARMMTLRGPKAKLIELPDIGHAPMFMQQEQIRLVQEFLET